ncbi:MAG: PEP-CTERM system histidine kinase PrsK [Gammaproteobacteria bacterium]|nr:PEP-CTERM system histidine kinase PrsK [Gammaproteobacteria bacterium]
MSDFGFLGFSLASVLFSLLSILLLTSWRGRLQGGLMLIATLVAAIWSALFAAKSGFDLIPLETIWIAEAVRNIAWCAFLIGLLSCMARQRNLSTSFFRTLSIVILLASAVLVLPDVFIPSFLVLDAQYLGQVVTAVAGMMLVEQLYRNTAPEQRWGIKYLCFGLGGMFAFDFYLFSDALLFKRIDIDLWYARGGVAMLTVPLLAVSAARNPTWSLDLFVSRRVVFHTTSLLSAGIYMLLMAFAGYYIKIYGGEWGPVLQITFLFAAILVLVALLFSGQARARTKIFINKHFFSYRYDYREEWLRLIRLLSGQETETPLFERVIWALGEIVDSTGGLLWLCSEKTDCQLVAHRNQAKPEMGNDPELSSLLAFFEKKQWVINLDEYLSQPELYEELALPPWITDLEGGWLIVPLIHDERVIGFVYLTRPRTKINVNWENLDLLKTAGRQAAGYLTLYKAVEALTEAKQFEGFNRLSAFVVHDLKNLIAQLSLVAKNAEKHRDNPAFIDDTFLTIQNAVNKMSRLMSYLHGTDAKRDFESIDLVRVVENATAAKSFQVPVPKLTVEPDNSLWVLADPERSEAIFGHIIQNAQDATAPAGEVEVKVSSDQNLAVVEIVDTGSGMDELFIRERLFRPFDSTKGLTGMGVGAHECREFVHSIGGRIEVDSKVGEGTTFKVLIPIADTIA